jgi:Sigma-70 region 2
MTNDWSRVVARMPREEQGRAGIAEWFAGAQRGDPLAVEGLLRAVLPTAQRFAARSCATREDAEDAVQEALTALCGALVRCAPPRRS